MTLTDAQLAELERATQEATAEVQLCTTRVSHIRAAAHANRLNALLASVYGYRDQAS